MTRAVINGGTGTGSCEQARTILTLIDQRQTDAAPAVRAPPRGPAPTIDGAADAAMGICCAASSTPGCQLMGRVTRRPWPNSSASSSVTTAKAPAGTRSRVANREAASKSALSLPPVMKKM